MARLLGFGYPVPNTFATAIAKRSVRNIPKTQATTKTLNSSPDGRIKKAVINEP